MMGFAKLRFLMSTIAFGITAIACPAWALDCGECDHLLTTASTVFDGSSVEPGGIVCLQAGANERKRFDNLSGTEASPIQVINCGGQVEIATESTYGLVLQNANHVRVTGTGAAGEKYGIRLKRTGAGSGVTVDGVSSNLEIDHLEIGDASYNGLQVLTPASCEAPNPGSQENISLHDLFIHDVAGEGVYFSSLNYPTGTGPCGTFTNELRRGVNVFDNLLVNIGYDGIDVSLAAADCVIQRNRIVRTGLAEVTYNRNGINLQTLTSCGVSNNLIEGAPEVGILAATVGETEIVNNSVWNTSTGIAVVRNSVGPFAMIHNTVVEASQRGLYISPIVGSDPSYIVNNFLVACEYDLGDGPIVEEAMSAIRAGNVITEFISGAKFVASSTGDFRLTKQSPAVDSTAGTDSWMLQTDLLGNSRDTSPDAGAYEWIEPSSPDPAGSGGASALGTGGATGGVGSSLGGSNDPVDPDEDESSADDRSTEADEDVPDSESSKEQGCIWRAGSTSPWGGAWFFAALGLVVLRHRRSVQMPSKVRFFSEE